MGDPLLTARRVARSLAEAGAEAVALVGSHAAGHANRNSDLDLAVVGAGPRYRLSVEDNQLVSEGWAEAHEQQRRLSDPAYLGTHVPGWRTAVILHDPSGIAASIRNEALAWTWLPVVDEVDAWVAETVTGLTEEAVKLSSSVQMGAATTAGVQKALLVLGLAQPLALRRRILYGSENRLWDALADELGPPWHELQNTALGIDPASVEEGCRAALRLFELAVDEVRPLLDERQAAVVHRGLRT